jgi:hypothetical protein
MRNGIADAPSSLDQKVGFSGQARGLNTTTEGIMAQGQQC